MRDRKRERERGRENGREWRANLEGEEEGEGERGWVSVEEAVDTRHANDNDRLRGRESKSLEVFCCLDLHVDVPLLSDSLPLLLAQPWGIWIKEAVQIGTHLHG